MCCQPIGDFVHKNIFLNQTSHHFCDNQTTKYIHIILPPKYVCIQLHLTLLVRKVDDGKEFTYKKVCTSSYEVRYPS